MLKENDIVIKMCKSKYSVNNRNQEKTITNLRSDLDTQKLHYDLKLVEMQEKLEMATRDRDVSLPIVISHFLKLKLY